MQTFYSKKRFLLLYPYCIKYEKFIVHMVRRTLPTYNVKNDESLPTFRLDIYGLNIPRYEKYRVSQENVKVSGLDGYVDGRAKIYYRSDREKSV